MIRLKLSNRKGWKLTLLNKENFGLVTGVTAAANR